jgi:hypothetical protein
MGIEFILGISIALAAVVGNYVGGRRNSALAESTISMLTARMDLFEREAGKIPMLHERIGILEELVTQRADVETVKQIVMRIEEKLDASP